VTEAESIVCFWNGSFIDPVFCRQVPADSTWKLVKLDITVFNEASPGSQLKKYKGIDKQLQKVLDTSKLVKRLK
jgi:hypothetical protein